MTVHIVLPVSPIRVCLLFQFQFEYFVVSDSHRLEISFCPEEGRRRMGAGMMVVQGKPGTILSSSVTDPSGHDTLILWYSDSAAHSITLPHKVPVPELEPSTVKIVSIVSTHTRSLIKTQLIDSIQTPTCSVQRMPTPGPHKSSGWAGDINANGNRTSDQIQAT